MRFLRAIQWFCMAVPVALVAPAAPVGTARADDPATTSLQEFPPAGPQLQRQALQPAPSHETLFWVVNSYHARQHHREIGGGPLGYHRRTSGGWHPATAAEFQSHFAPGVPVAIMIHGSFIDWDTQSRYAEATYHWLSAAAAGRPLHVVFFHWPSGSPYTYCPGVDVPVRGSRAEFNGFHVMHVMTLVPPASPVCLIAHSHGARGALAALHLASGGVLHEHVYAGGNPHPRRLRAILAGAAVDHHWLNPGQRYDHALCGADVINLKNRKDLILNLYHLARPLGRPSLATVGFTDRDRRKLGQLGWRAVDVDVSELIQEHHTWPNFLRSGAIAATIVRYALFEDEVLIEGQRTAAGESPGAPDVVEWRELED